MMRDEAVVRNMVDTMEHMVDPFTVSNELTSISTGVQARSEAKTDVFTAHLLHLLKGINSKMNHSLPL